MHIEHFIHNGLLDLIHFALHYSVTFKARAIEHKAQSLNKEITRNLK